MLNIKEKLSGGDLRSIGRSDEVVKEVQKNPKLFKELFELIFDSDPLVRMRASDAVEKIATENHDILIPYKDKIINKMTNINQQEVRWHNAQLISYLDLNDSEEKKVIKILNYWIDSEKSNIVKVFSMQALADIAEKNPDLKSSIINRIKLIIKTGAHSQIARGKKLLKQLEKNEKTHQN